MCSILQFKKRRQREDTVSTAGQSGDVLSHACEAHGVYVFAVCERQSGQAIR